MTWSGRRSSAVLADAYTACVRTQAVLQVFFVRYTSYELLFDGRDYFIFQSFYSTVVAMFLFQNFYSSVFNTIVVLSV